MKLNDVQNNGKSHKHWYLLVYDIRQPQRLRRVHYYIKKQGIFLQRSVYLLKQDRKGLDVLISGVQQRVNDREDDVRIYPVNTPGTLWTAGNQEQTVAFLYGPAPSGAARKKATILSGIRRLFTRR